LWFWLKEFSVTKRNSSCSERRLVAVLGVVALKSFSRIGKEYVFSRLFAEKGYIRSH
jgi:hypothetical protein